MTNAEKFEEVFGIKIAKNYPADICDSVDPNICIENDCSDCPIFGFWNQEYKEEV